MQVKAFLGSFYTNLRVSLTMVAVGCGIIIATGADKLPDNPTDRLNVKKGAASYYNNSFVGKKTASGEIFSQKKLTCASNVYPLGTWLRVTNIRNGKSVIVKVNDRMHPRMRRVVDLSQMAAQELGFINAGVTQVEVENLGKIPPTSSAKIK